MLKLQKMKLPSLINQSAYLSVFVALDATYANAKFNYIKSRFDVIHIHMYILVFQLILFTA